MEMKRAEYLPDVCHEDRALRDEVSAEHAVLRRSMREAHRRDGVPAQHLLQYRLDIRQLLPVLHLRQSLSTRNSIDLRLRLLLDVRVEHHREEEAIDRANSRIRAAAVDARRGPLGDKVVLLGLCLVEEGGDVGDGVRRACGGGQRHLVLDENIGPFNELVSVVAPPGCDALEGGAGEPVGNVTHCRNRERIVRKIKFGWDESNSRKGMMSTIHRPGVAARRNSWRTLFARSTK